MKKLMIAVGLGLLSGSLYAACNGPYCYDDVGASVNGTSLNGVGVGVPSFLKANINSTSPMSKGQVIWCSDCTQFNGGKGFLCVSTGTASGAYVALSSAAAVTTCQ